MKRLLFPIVAAIAATVLLTSAVNSAAEPPQGFHQEVPSLAVITHSGKVTLLRVHEVGTRYGAPPGLDIEVVIRLDSEPNNAYGFQLRDDANRLVHQGMLDLLRDAFANNWTVFVDEQNGSIFRLWVTKP